MSPSRRAPRQPDPAVALENLSPRRRAMLNALNDSLPLLILAMALLFASRLLVLSGLEASTLKFAAQPFTSILARFRSGLGVSAASPLFGLILHAWLRLTAGTFVLLRAPSGLFFLAGMWLLSRVAGFWSGEAGANILLWLAALWPYAFLYGPQATRYSLAFLLIAAVMWACLRLGESARFSDWLLFCVLGVALVYITYVGWAVLLLLLVNHWQRNRSRGGTGARLLAAAVFFGIAYAPVWASFFRDARAIVGSHTPWRALLIEAGVNFYALFVSESVAPWFWRLGIPAMLAIVAMLVVAFLNLRWEVRSFFLVGLALIAIMDLWGALQAERLLLVAPFFLLAIAVSICAMENAYLRRGMLAALLVISAIGWYGTFARRYYATGSFAEPWPALAAETAGALQQSGAVVSDSQPFFVYLTYDLGGPRPNDGQALSYFPELPSADHIWSSESWQAANRPLAPYMIVIHALSDSADSKSMDDASSWLDQHCGGRVSRLLVRNPSFAWKERYFPQAAGSSWQIEIRQYLCGEFAPRPNATPSTPGTQPKASH